PPPTAPPPDPSAPARAVPAPGARPSLGCAGSRPPRARRTTGRPVAAAPARRSPRSPRARRHRGRPVPATGPADRSRRGRRRAPPAPLARPARPAARLASTALPTPLTRTGHVTHPPGRCLVVAALFGHLVEEGHELVGDLGRHACDLVDVFALQVKDILQRLVSGALEHVHQLDRQTLQLPQRDLGRRLVLRRGKRRKERPLAAALQPLATRV